MRLERWLNKVIEFSFYALFIVVPLILTPYNYELFEFNKMLTVYFFTALITGAWIIKMLIRNQILIKKTPFDLVFLFFLATQIISTIISIDPHTSVWGYYSRFNGGLLSTICYLLLFYAFVANLADQPNQRQTKNCLKLILITGLVVASYGILERLGIDKNVWVQDVQSRVFSTLGQPNWLAAYLLMLIPLSLAFSFKLKKIKSSALFFLAAGVYFITLLLTKSRSGLAGFSVAFAIFWGLILLKKGFRKFPWKKLFWVSLVFALLLCLIGSDFTPSLKQLLSRSSPEPTTNTETQTEEPTTAPPAISLGGSKSSDIRKVVWRGALNIWRHYPIFGSGVETFAYAYYNFRPVEHNSLSEWDYLYNKAHNEFLNFLATTGIVGLLSYVLIIVWFSLWSIKQILARPAPNYLLLAAFLAGYLGLAVSNFFGFSVVPVALFFFLWPALALDLSHKPPAQVQKSQLASPIPYFRVALIVLATGWVLVKVVTLWQADRIFNLGRNFLSSAQLTSAYQYLQKSVELSPREPLFRSYYSEAAAKLALFYHQQIDQVPEAAELRDKLINEAIGNSDIVIQQNKVHLNFWKSRAKVFFYLSEIDSRYQENALEAMEGAIKLAPTDPKLEYNLGLLYVQMNQLQLGQQALEKAIELKPDYEPARYALGSLYEKLDQPDQAKLQYQYILEHLNPQNEPVKEKLEQL